MVTAIKQKDPKIYAKLFGLECQKDDPPERDGTQGELSALTKAMWTEWLLHVAACDLERPKQMSMLKVAPAPQDIPASVFF